ncbi:hypothetical protein FHX42_002363 [Saccharopolyspora lacisalsi]|uniref:Uncharacterized protein n=1 Tax=Halosaccharopolyspora lacisalsi TaxID=1000566 RepID=A0A839DXR5_9PSEU|nr:hypothetical protein [Halosaccharopolyspora lacisalsi]MBA8825016.1 hypothetical protein [Halosaccharopolyspora lacisalsi]
MSKENRILLACLVGACVLPLVVGGLLGWPTWITVPLFAAVLVGSYRKFTHGTRTATGHVGALLDRIGLYPDNPVRDLTAHRLANLIEASGNARVAEEVRRKFDAPR